MSLKRGGINNLLKGNRVQIKSMDGNEVVESAFDLESEGDSNYEFIRGDTDKPLSNMSVAEQQLWYLKGIFWMVFTIGALLIAGAITLIVLAAIIASADQTQKAITVVDRVYEMRDYTKTMTDLTVGSQESIAKAMKDFDVENMVKNIQNVISKGDSLMQTVQPDVLQHATTMGTQILNTLQRFDMDEGRKLMQNLNNWSSSVDPTHLKEQIVDPMHTFLTSTNAMLQKAQEENVLQRVTEVASATVDLESRLQRLNEITIRIPDRK